MATPGFASASLYVGDLTPDVTEALLFDLFNAVGPVASIRVCRDTVTRRSLGYAYVNFHSVMDAERALDTMNFTNIRNRPCRIMWSHRDPSIRKSGLGNIFVKNLDKSVDNKALYDTFSMFGNILSCKVATDENNASRGYGFVHYETREAADQAIAKVDGMVIADKRVFVSHFVPRSERHTSDPSATFTNIYVKNLEAGIDEGQLREAFEKFGPITNLSIARDNSGASRSFGFINYKNHEDARQAVDSMNGAKLGASDKLLYVGRAQKKSEREAELRNRFEQLKMERQSKYAGVNLYVKNLDDTIDDAKLREEFARFGSITSACIMRDNNGRSRGFGFVCFSTPEEATKAVTDMNGKMLMNKPLYVALAQRKEQRRAQLEAEHARRMHSVNARMMPRMDQAQHMQTPMGYPGPQMYFPHAMPPQARQGFVYPQSMMHRRWPSGGQPRPPYMAYAAAGPGLVPVQGGRQPQHRAGRAGNGMQGGMPQPGGRPQSGSPQGGQMDKPQNGRVSGGPGGLGGAPGGPMMGGHPRGRNSNYKFTQQARNRGDPGMPVGVQANGSNPSVPSHVAAPSSVMPGGPEPLTSSALAAAPPEQQKQMLGERLFPIIQQQQPDLAGKITGMLLEMDNYELLHLLESPELLNQKVQEAVDVLNDNQEADGEGEH